MYAFHMKFRGAGLVLALLVGLAISTPAFAQHEHSMSTVMPDTAAISLAIGRPGTYIASENVYKIAVPRTDIKVMVDGAQIPPFMGLASWVAFEPGHAPDSTMVMGDLVLFQDEVNPVMSALLDNGLAVTGLHNHFFYAQPMVFYMHLGGMGSAELLTRGVRKAFDAIRDVRTRNSQPSEGFDHPPIATESTLKPKEFEDISHTTAAASDGMVKITLGRKVTMDGCQVGKEMGVASWAAFRGTESESEVDGDIATTEGELQTVLRTLRHGGIDVVAIHNHMEDETPRLIFLHYWGVGPAHDLAQVVESAFEKVSSQGHAGG